MKKYIVKIYNGCGLNEQEVIYAENKNEAEEKAFDISDKYLNDGRFGNGIAWNLEEVEGDFFSEIATPTLEQVLEKQNEIINKMIISLNELADNYKQIKEQYEQKKSI